MKEISLYENGKMTTFRRSVDMSMRGKEIGCVRVQVLRSKYREQEKNAMFPTCVASKSL